MSTEDVTVAPGDDAPWIDPLRLLLGGLAAAVIAFLVFQLPALVSSSGAGLTGSFWTMIRVLLLLGGALAVGGAVALQPQSPRNLFLAALTAWLIGFAMDPAWDTARLVMLILATIALIAAFLLALPFLMGRLFLLRPYLVKSRDGLEPHELEARGRFTGWVLSRVIVSLLVVVHFTGIVSRVMATPPPSREPSWLAYWVSYELQNYTDFCYLNNAFRFYSPEPGEPTLVWFYLQYSDGSSRWVKLPNKQEQEHLDWLGQEFTRRLSLGNAIGQVTPLTGLPADVRERRIKAGSTLAIPTHPEYAVEAQYQPPLEHCQRNMAEFARFVAQHYPAENPEAKVVCVKAYRVLHVILAPQEMASPRIKPTDPWTYLPSFMGEFTPNGEMVDPNDPLLYWVIPIYAWPHGAEPPPPFIQVLRLEKEKYEQLDVHDFLQKHAQLPPTGGARPQ
jgi:hypothetical protein